MGDYLLFTILNSVGYTCMICSFDIVMEIERENRGRYATLFALIGTSHTDLLNLP